MAVWSEVNYSYVFQKYRFDSEFYRPDYLELEHIFLKSCKSEERIQDVAIVIPDQFKRADTESFFQYNDIGSVDTLFGTISENLLKIKNAPGRATYINRKDDVLISTVRPNRNANAIIEDKEILQIGSNGFCNLRAIKIDPNFLYIYSKTKYFRDYLVRFSKSSMYPTVANSDILKFPFFRPGEQEYIDNVSAIIKKARNLLLESQALYTQAKQLLEQELELDKLKFYDKNFYETNFAKVTETRIIDSKYHHPKYETLVDNLKLKYTTFKLKQIASVEYGYMPTQDYETDPNKGIPLIRVTNIKDDLEIKIEDLKYIPNAVKVHKKKFVEHQDILMVQCGDTTGKVGYIFDEIKGHLFPSFCLSVKVYDNRFDPLFLAALLKTKYMQILFDQTVMINTVRPNTTKPRFENLEIPLLDNSFQDKISSLLQKSKQAKRESQQLLNQAKIRVEQLIEEVARKNG